MRHFWPIRRGPPPLYERYVKQARLVSFARHEGGPGESSDLLSTWLNPLVGGSNGGSSIFCRLEGGASMRFGIELEASACPLAGAAAWAGWGADSAKCAPVWFVCHRSVRPAGQSFRLFLSSPPIFLPTNSDIDYKYISGGSRDAGSREQPSVPTPRCCPWRSNPRAKRHSKHPPFRNDERFISFALFRLVWPGSTGGLRSRATIIHTNDSCAAAAQGQRDVHRSLEVRLDRAKYHLLQTYQPPCCLVRPNRDHSDLCLEAQNGY